MRHRRADPWTRRLQCSSIVPPGLIPQRTTNQANDANDSCKVLPMIPFCSRFLVTGPDSARLTTRTSKLCQNNSLADEKEAIQVVDDQTGTPTCCSPRSKRVKGEGRLLRVARWRCGQRIAKAILRKHGKRPLIPTIEGQPIVVTGGAGLINTDQPTKADRYKFVRSLLHSSEPLPPTRLSQKKI